MIDVEDDDEGGLSMNKEYERKTMKLKKRSKQNYLMDKGVDEDDIYIDVDTEDDYISVEVGLKTRNKRRSK